ncbi:Flavin-dependent monooxygenase, oxygenase subunit HsaA [Thalassovita gelatinovora]|uniref:Flavin-dependent monooxygenase, oxygenase subunit HsaA n=1 Tax=Thalassovita gelatinovora TaxID=53501 RepID=A0A0P1FB35_THAGE|nr:acyl-CoA dehydrogenase family protein [Thalassovita gelatinovora]QIZ80713.1 flavin-dependent monooxygenase [Thalassovita gelatinovora]CUH65312.1 Flavin-dependent monooxygenase, oxygenase subunit HsaA [Thalassovita gelatinovora]SEQ89220.1 Acyl-CoA dehydrogenase [Thalassovita gelatinovora]
MTADAALAEQPLTKDEVLASIRARATEFQNLRHIPQDVVDQFKALGVYRAFVPARFGGDEISPAAFCRLIEDISAADASAGWVASFGVSATYLSTLPTDTYAEIFGKNPDTVFAGAMFPPQPAKTVAGGYEVTGQWPWGSGIMGADLAGAGIKVEDQNTKLPLIAIMPKAKVEVVDTWKTLGLRATGSHDIKVDRVVVPREWTFIRGSKPTMDDRIFRYPSMALASQVLAVVALGAARAALDFLHNSGSRQSVTGAPKPGARPYLQTEYAKARGMYLGAQALFYDTLDEAYAELEHQETVSRDTHIRLRLVASKAAKDGAEAARMAFALGGSAAINEGHPLGRYMLDAAGVAQHAFLSEGTWTGAGAAMFDEPTMPGYP